MKTDNELKQLLAKMLPDKVYSNKHGLLFWRRDGEYQDQVRNTELLHICWLIEQTLSETNLETYEELLCGNNTEQSCIETWCWIHASWQQRTTALAKVKGLI